MRVPDNLLKCVGFVSLASDHPQYIGTTFIVDVPGKWGNAYPHAVTARHVATRLASRKYLLGFNFKDGDAGWFGSELRWWFHPTEEESVDVAVTVFTPTSRFDVESIPQSIFATDERIKRYSIGVGDEVNVVGLFSQFSGSRRHFPIVRTATSP